VSRRVLISVALLALAGPALAQTPPVARTVDTVDHPYGLTIPDPYRWMEGPNNAEFKDWLKAQGAAGRAKLDASPAMKKWQARLGAASTTVVNNGQHHRAGDRIFYMHYENGGQGVLHVRLEDGSDKVLFDPSTVTGGQHASVTGYSVSPDGKRVAINIDRGGDEITTIEFYDVDSGKKLADNLDRVWGEFQAQWLGNDAIAYTQMAPAGGQTDAMLNMRARYHRLGGDASADPTLAAAGGNPGLTIDPQEFPSVTGDPSSDKAVLIMGGAHPELRICVDKAADMATAPAFTCLVGYADQVTNLTLLGNTLYLVTIKDAPNGRVLALDLSKPGVTLGDAKVVLPGSEFEGKSLVDIIKSAEGKNPGVFNNAAQVWNHTFFWHSMKPNGGGAPTGKIADKINEDFGSFDAFAEAFKTAGATQFGSGWAWLVVGSDGKLKVTKTPNGENPFTKGDKPILTVDVWEHAYYLDYQNLRPKFLETFLANLVNWDFVNERLDAPLFEGTK
jgi:superoxide dismutase